MKACSKTRYLLPSATVTASTSITISLTELRGRFALEAMLSTDIQTAVLVLNCCKP